MLLPDTLDRMVPAAPWETARARYAELAHDDRPGDPWAEPFDAREEPSRMIVWAVIAAVLLIGMSLIASVS